MATENWIKSLEAILHHEGGYVNHPKDPGGETNLGVTKRVYEDFGGEKEMKDLTKVVTYCIKGQSPLTSEVIMTQILKV